MEEELLLKAEIWSMPNLISSILNPLEPLEVERIINSYLEPSERVTTINRPSKSLKDLNLGLRSI